jgi:aldose 1-epimerase
MTYGATLLTLSAPDRRGKIEPVTLHLDTLADYVKGHPLFGSVVGRYANRIANARFAIDDVEYKLTANADPHHIHGGRGPDAFHEAVWSAEPVRGAAAVGVRLTHVSPDGAAGFPGTVRASVTYTLATGDNRLVMAYEATTDKPTHVNLTNHAYWNLAGAGSGDVLGHVLRVNAKRYLVADEKKIPTGEVREVRGTPMDFTEPKPVGSRIEQVEGQNYDHCYVLDKDGVGAGKEGLDKEGPGRLSLAARVSEPTSGRVMEVYTTQPGVQVYTAKGLTDKFRGGGKPYGPYHGLCLETQHYPDAPNQPTFPSTLLRPGQTLREVTEHRFGVEG